jgi:hypothetical protein
MKKEKPSYHKAMEPMEAGAAADMYRYADAFLRDSAA